jgi:hypothetical protein
MVHTTLPPPVAVADKDTEGTIKLVAVKVFTLPIVQVPVPPFAVQTGE